MTITCHPFPKTSTDISVVWNCTDNVVNPSIYITSLFFTTDNTLHSHIEVNMEQEDFDVIKEFHNYVLEKLERPYHEFVIPKELCETEELADPLMR